MVWLFRVGDYGEDVSPLRDLPESGAFISVVLPMSVNLAERLHGKHQFLAIQRRRATIQFL